MDNTKMDVAIVWLMAIGGIFIGAGFSIWGFTDGNRSTAIWIGFFGCLLLLLAGAIQLQQIVWKVAERDLDAPGTGGRGGAASVGGSGIAIGGAGGDAGLQGQGGKGGSVSVGGSGLAIGGPGGHAGKYGRGGDGGGGGVKGDGIAVGGGGGSVDSDTHWYPPAPSGYEVHQKAMGLPVDPRMRQFGRGGMSPGYASRYRIVEDIRNKYFNEHNGARIDALYDVKAVPLEYVNEELERRGYNWQAAIVGLDYEFFVPPKERGIAAEGHGYLSPPPKKNPTP